MVETIPMSSLPDVFADEATLTAATEIANKAEELFNDRETAAVLYALGMLVAHAISHSSHRNTDKFFDLLRRIATLELNRQFTN